jgi:hypothetical protein
MHTTPSGVDKPVQEEKSSSRFRRPRATKEADVELNEVVVTSVEAYKGRSNKGAVQSEISHYTLAEQMINYQSIDFGTRCKEIPPYRGCGFC